MKREAFTLVELLTCIAIVAAVSVVAAPVMVRAKRSAQISSAAQNMKSLHTAIVLYQSDWSQSENYGYAHEMGLPSIRADGSIDLVWSKVNNGNSSCGNNPSWIGDDIVLHDLIYRPFDEDTFPIYSRRYRENTMLFMDVNCDDPDRAISNRYEPHRGIGVTYSGQLIHQVKPGDIFVDDWWSSPPD